MSGDKDFLGKKVVFINPPDIVKGPIIELLTDEEFEIYILMDHQKVSQIFSKYPDTIFFIYVDAVQSEQEWQSFIKEIHSVHPGIQLGIMSFKITDPEQVQYYLLDLGVLCGFIQLKQGINAATNMMMKVLKANEVKGRRKYIRYQCNLDDSASLNFPLFDAQINGEILDISSVGMSCTLSSNHGLVKNQLIRNVQMRLRGTIVKTDVILMGTRIVPGEQTVYVFLFKADVDNKMKEKVHSFIFKAFQKSFNREFSIQH